MKITAKYIKDRVEKMKAEGHKIDVKFEGQPAKPRIVNDADDRNLSSLLSPQDMDIWLDGYTACAEYNRVTR